MFLVRCELKKYLRTLSKHSEQNPKFLVNLKLPHGVKQSSSRKKKRSLIFAAKHFLHEPWTQRKLKDCWIFLLHSSLCLILSWKKTQYIWFGQDLGSEILSSPYQYVLHIYVELRQSKASQLHRVQILQINLACKIQNHRKAFKWLVVNIGGTRSYWKLSKLLLKLQKMSVWFTLFTSCSN